MNKNVFRAVGVLIIAIIFSLQSNTVFALSTKLPIKKSPTPITYTDSSIQSIITSIFNKLIEQILPKDKLSALLNFSNQLTYDPNKQGLQLIYHPTATDGSETYFSATNLSSSSFISDTATINSDLSVSGSAEIQGGVSLGPTRAGTLEVGSGDQPLGITIYDRTTKQPVCIFSDNTVLQISTGSCVY